MKMLSRKAGTLSTLAGMICVGLTLHATAENIPAQLSKSDGKPGDTTRPVKVYLLAGQSNMVGMGDISGARPAYPNLFLSADPAIIPGVTPVGSKDGGKALAWVPVSKHGVFEAKAEVYAGPGDTTQPVRTLPVALGTVAENLPAIDGAEVLVVSALMEVPASGTYTIHSGFGSSSHNVVLLDGKEVYHKDVGGKPVIMKVALEAGKRYPLRIAYFKSGSAAFWLEQVDIEGKGDLMTLTKKDGKYPFLLDDIGGWSIRNDVSYTDPRLFPDRAGSRLSATSNNGKSIGPELGFGWVMGTFHEEQVLLIKTAMGNRSLGFDFRPPSSGRTDAANHYEGLEYRLMIEGIHKTLAELEKVLPDYQGQGYEIAGFCWFQGHKDSGAAKEEYEKNLINLISDLRKEFKAPKMAAVVATVGFDGYRIAEGPWRGVWEAQMAVGDPTQYPEHVGTVASVDTRDFWRERDESPADQGYHYNRNPETYLLIGEAMGRAMVRLQGGEAGSIPKSDREARTAARVASMAVEAAKPAATVEQKAAALEAIKPLVLDGALVAYLSNPRNQPLLQASVKGEKPKKVAPLLEDALDDVGDFYRTIGIRDYDWKPFGGELKLATWDYFSFDLPANQTKGKSIDEPGLPFPIGMENWFAPDFDAKKAGWRSGAAPFGLAKDPVSYPTWYGPSKHVAARTIIDQDVLLLRQTFELPPLKDGYRYRIRVGGSAHANSGEGYAIYVNGKLLAESKGGITAWRREGGKPRGGHVWADFRQEFKDTKVLIAVSNFPMNNRAADAFIPAGASLGVWLEEMKIPPGED
jgi:hypothetical protein